MKKAAILTSTRKSGAKRRGVSDVQKDGLEGLDTTVNAFIQFPELRTESYHGQEVVPFTGTHN
jgi:hypothetical protein